MQKWAVHAPTCKASAPAMWSPARLISWQDRMRKVMTDALGQAGRENLMSCKREEQIGVHVDLIHDASSPPHQMVPMLCVLVRVHDVPIH